MRIALLAPGFSAGPDDWAIPALQTLACALAQEHDLHIFSLRYPAAGSYEWGGFVHHATGGGQRFGFASPGIWRQTVGAIIQQHRERPFDILHAFWADEPGLVAVWAAARIRRPVVVSIGGGELSYLPDINYGTQHSLIRSQIIRLSFRGAGVVTAGSAYQLDLARQQKLDMTKTCQIPLGVDTKQFQPGPIPHWERPTIVQAASLTPVKNQKLLLEVMALIKRQIPTVRLLLAGEGPLRSQLKQLVKEHRIEDTVTLRDAVPFNEMARFFQQGHLYVQSSRHESQGMAVIEAMSCGVPAIGTAVGVMAEIASLPANPKPDTLANQAMKILSDPARYKILRQEARQKVIEEYSLEKTIRHFLDIYDRLSRRQ